MHERFDKFSMSDVLVPTVNYACDGHPVAPVIDSYVETNLRRFESAIAEAPFDFANARAAWFAEGRPPAGEFNRNPDLVTTLETIGRYLRSGALKLH
ncbi:hypothetical protein ASS64_14930 [Erythrobacter sp. AP23]|nr:hypothetical protein ASS64_14930 [Erythrobacter sp. AP23]